MDAGVHRALVRRGNRNAEQRIDFRQQSRERAAFAQDSQHPRRTRFREALCEFLPDSLRRECREFARGNDRAHQRFGFRRDCEPQPRGKPRDAEHAQRILDESL